MSNSNCFDVKNNLTISYDVPALATALVTKRYVSSIIVFLKTSTVSKFRATGKIQLFVHLYPPTCEHLIKYKILSLFQKHMFNGYTCYGPSFYPQRINTS